MNQELDQAVSDIRNQPVDDAVVEAAAARVWARLATAVTGVDAVTGVEQTLSSVDPAISPVRSQLLTATSGYPTPRRSSFSRSSASERCRWLFTVPSGMLNVSAISEGSRSS